MKCLIIFICVKCGDSVLRSACQIYTRMCVFLGIGYMP